MTRNYFSKIDIHILNSYYNFVSRYKFSGPNLISPPTKYFLILLPNLGSYKYFPYKPHKLFWAISQILPITSCILSNLGSHTNTNHTTTKIGPQNYTIFTKSPNSFTLWVKSKKPNKTHKAHCYTAPLKLVATRQL